MQKLPYDGVYPCPQMSLFLFFFAIVCWLLRWQYVSVRRQRINSKYWKLELYDVLRKGKHLTGISWGHWCLKSEFFCWLGGCSALSFHDLFLTPTFLIRKLCLEISKTLCDCLFRWCLSILWLWSSSLPFLSSLGFSALSRAVVLFKMISYRLQNLCEKNERCW